MTTRHHTRTVLTRSLRPGCRRQRGFGYIGLLILVAMMSVAFAATGQVWRTAQQREKEQELLFAGGQFRSAIAQFYANTPGKARRYPLHLEELLQDPRHPGIRRYLRTIYRDPMTGTAEWGLVTGPGGEIFGVYSRSEDAPLKKASFRLAEKDFEGRTKYSEWVFMPAVR